MYLLVSVRENRKHSILSSQSAKNSGPQTIIQVTQISYLVTGIAIAAAFFQCQH
jgi:hypothetical protein